MQPAVQSHAPEPDGTTAPLSATPPQDRHGFELPAASGDIPQIDELKGLAILGVLALHALPVGLLFDGWAPLTLGQAVPVFAVLMGLNGAASLFRKEATHLREAYAAPYVRSRVERLYLPFLVVFVGALLVALTRGELKPGNLAGLVTGELAVGGPGNYFIGFALSFAVIFPAFFVIYRKAPAATVVLAFIASFCFELVASRIGLFSSRPYFYASSFVRFLPLVCVGVLMADRMRQGRSLPRWWGAAAIVGLAYVVAVCIDPSLFSWSTDDWRRWGMTGIAAFYTGGIAYAGLRWLPTGGRVLAVLQPLGRASYHIFLLQILWFVLFPDRSVWFAPFALLACCALGLAFFRLTPRLPQSYRSATPGSGTSGRP